MVEKMPHYYIYVSLLCKRGHLFVAVIQNVDKFKKRAVEIFIIELYGQGGFFEYFSDVAAVICWNDHKVFCVFRVGLVAVNVVVMHENNIVGLCFERAVAHGCLHFSRDHV